MDVKQKIKVGIITETYDVPVWIYKMIERIKNGNYAEIILILKLSDTIITPKKRKLKINKHTLFNYYNKFEQYFFASGNDPFVITELKNIVNEIPEIDINYNNSGTDTLPQQDVESIQKHNIDVFILIGEQKLKGNILNIAKYGVWSLYHGDTNVRNGGPSGFWEVFQQKRELGATLQILNEDWKKHLVLYRSWSTIHRLVNQTINGYYWKSSLFIPRKLNELYQVGGEKFMEKVHSENEHLQFYSHPYYDTPVNYQFIKLFISNYYDWLKLNIWKAYYIERWILLYSFDKNIATNIYKYNRLTPPKDRDWADPFVIYENDKYYIFCEELIKKEKKGHISVMELDRNGKLTDPKIILKKPYHLSYPFIFQEDGKYYMIPECEENNTISLYVCTAFPYEWEFCMNLMEGIKAVDTTLFKYDNKFWIFTNLIELQGACYSDELFLFYSDNLFSNNWVSHPMNPIVSDVKSSRPAGKLFYQNDTLYRPSQDCSFSYGYATVINEVLKLNETEYEERKVSEITPKWNKDVIAVHSLSYNKELTCIDARIARKRFF